MGPDKYGITVNPLGLAGAQARTYCYQVREHLKWIERTKSGKILFNSIKYYGNPVEIRPYTGNFGACNATADTEVASPTIGGIFDAIATAGRSLIKGVITYSPSTWSKHGPCQPAGIPRQGEMWDEVLFHELVHVFRSVSGKSGNVRIPMQAGLKHYTNNEEFYAVMLQNIYVADKTNKIKTGLIGNHGHWPLVQQYRKPWGFYSESSQVFDLVDKFCQDHKGLSKRMANDLADSEFNPLADYYADREKARAISRAALNKDLEVLMRDMTSWLF
jgi:hypothetical protein